jgi:hypothetical protein
MLTVFQAYLMIKPTFQLCHNPILNNATDTSTLITMHDIIFIDCSKINLDNTIHDYCKAPKADCVACE